MTKTNPLKLRDQKARRRALKSGFRLSKSGDRYRLFYTASGEPWTQVLAGNLERVEGWLSENVRA